MIPDDEAVHQQQRDKVANYLRAALLSLRNGLWQERVHHELDLRRFQNNGYYVCQCGGRGRIDSAMLGRIEHADNCLLGQVETARTADTFYAGHGQCRACGLWPDCGPIREYHHCPRWGWDAPARAVAGWPG